MLEVNSWIAAPTDNRILSGRKQPHHNRSCSQSRPRSWSFDASHWRTENITLTGFNKPNVIVKIVVTNDHGNNLYLDNINLSAFGATGIKKESINGNLLEVFPNPSADFANILHQYEYRR